MSCFKLLFLSLIASFSFISGSMAQTPSSAEAACEVIHRYESYCGNLSPDACFRYRQGFDYSGNAEQRQAWDDYFNLCGQDVSRYSHQCVAYLGIASECIPSVEAPLEPAVRYEQPTQYQVIDPVPVSVAYERPLEYQVCCQSPAATPTAIPVTPSPVESPSVELPTDHVPGPADSPIAATPAPTALPIAEPSIPDGPAGAIAEDDADEEREFVPGKVTNSAPSFFQMSGTGCSLQSQASRSFQSVEWLALVAALAILASRRATLR